MYLRDGEECDDGNTTNGDGCSWECLREGASSSSSSSSSSGTCNDNQDNDGDGLKDAESVISCTDIQTASDLNSVQFKKGNQESSYPNPWPDYSGIPAIKNALTQDDPAVKPYVVPIDQVPTGLQEGYMQCLFGSDVLSISDDGRTYKVAAQVQDQGQKNAYVCDGATATVNASQTVNALVKDSQDAYDYDMSVANDGGSAQASWTSRLWGMLFAANSSFSPSNPGPGADPYNARVALTRDCYQKGAPIAQQKAGQNQRLYTFWLEKLQTECVCGGSNEYSTFNHQNLATNIETQKQQIKTNREAALNKANTDKVARDQAISNNASLSQDQKNTALAQSQATYTADVTRINNEADAKTREAENQGGGLLETTKNILIKGIADFEKKLPELKGRRKDDLQNQINNLKETLRRLNEMTVQDASKPDKKAFILNTFNSLVQSQVGCFDNCVTDWLSKYNQSTAPMTVFQQCRASCVAEMCPFERPPYQPVKTTISTPAPPGGNGGGGGTIGGGGTSRAASSSAASSAGAATSAAASDGATAGTTGGTTAGGPGPSQPFPSYSRSSVAISSTSSVAVSGEACITKYIVPDGLAPDPAKQLGDGEQFAYTGQYFAGWNFQDAQRIQKDFNVFLGDVVYQKGAKRFTRGVWSTVSLDGTFSKPVQADVPTIPNDKAFKTSSGLYDGKDTIWDVTAQGYPCKEVFDGHTMRTQCDVIVQKTTVSTNTAKQIVIPNTSWMGPSSIVWESLLASDGSLWISVHAGDVLINVRPDMSVKVVPFPSKDCTSIGRPYYRFGSEICRGAYRLAEGPDGSIWFTTQLQAEAEKYPQIGMVKKDGTVKMLYSPSVWEEIIYVSSFFQGYDGAMWFTYTRPNAVGVLAPAETKHVGRMTVDGALSFVQTPATVSTMAAGKDGMWYNGIVVQTSGSSSAKAVLGFLGKTQSTLQALPASLDFRMWSAMNPLLVDKDNVPWTRIRNWKNASSASSLPLAQYLEPVTFLPDTQSVIKFACGSSSSRSSVSSPRSSSASSVAQCPANGCALNDNAGDTFCATQGLVCTPTKDLPCVKCVPKDASSSSKAPDPRCQQNGCTALGGDNICATLNATCKATTDFPCYVCDYNAFSSRSFSSRRSSLASSLSTYSSFSNNSAYSAYSTYSAYSNYSLPPSYASSSAGIVSLIVCGNGVTDPGEQCDDGNLSDTDFCTTGCRINPNPVAQSSSRPIVNRSASSSSMYVAIGAPRPGFNPMFCGNGRLDLAEDCDLGTQNSDLPNASCRSDCSLTRCGDQVVDGIRGEQCDDGNGIDGDGCSSACTLEQFAGNPSSAPVLPGSLIELPFVPGTPNQPSVVTRPLPIPAHGPVGDTGPETVAIMAAGASAGYTWMKMRKMKKGVQ